MVEIRKLLLEKEEEILELKQMLSDGLSVSSSLSLSLWLTLWLFGAAMFTHAECSLSVGSRVVVVSGVIRVNF